MVAVVSNKTVREASGIECLVEKSDAVEIEVGQPRRSKEGERVQDPEGPLHGV